MNRYLKLVHMEIHRFRYILASLMVITFIVETSAMMYKLFKELAKQKADPLYNGVTGPYVPEGMLSFTWTMANSQFYYKLSILLCVIVLAAYVFLIWYRDWLGRNTFIYRLLMLPGARIHIYLSKLTAILLFVFGMISYQLMLLPIQKLIFNGIVPAAMRVDSYWVEVLTANTIFQVLIPRSFEQFVTIYGLGIMAVLVIFTAILLERSYRRIGILYAIVYVGYQHCCHFIACFYWYRQPKC